jgi:serine/threonine-protein kinase
VAGEASEVFISYKAEDRGRVKPLVDALEAEGLSVWWDAHIAPGAQWRETILEHLEAARCVIVVWSRRSVGPAGEFVRDEATRAKRRKAYLPVRIDKVDPPLGFGETQALALNGWKGDRSDPRYRAVVSAVHDLLERDAPPANIQQPMLSRRGMLLGGAAGLTAISAGAGWFLLRTPPATSQSIAVLPFANLSGDAAQDYFSDGIAEELRSVLSRIPGLKVVARTSSEAVRDADAHTAASKLRVRNILTGSVRRSPQMIRVAAQMVDGSTGTELWSDVYDRPFGDMLKIQTDIATMVAQSLSIHLEGAQERALQEGGTQNAEAQDLLLQAQGAVWRNDDPKSLRHALELIDGALALDPRYADALAAKAAIINSFGSFFASNADDAKAKSAVAEKLAREAISLAPKSGLAHLALANTLWNSLRLRPGLAEFERTADLSGENVSFFNGFDPYALALASCRRFDAALGRCDRLIATDPLNPNAFTTRGVVLVHRRQYTEAFDIMAKALALGPDLRWPKAFQAFCLMQSGQLQQAREAFDAIAGPGPWLAMAAVLADRQGRHADSERIVQTMHGSMGDAGHFQYAEVFAQQGRTDEAIAALERAWAKRDPGLPFMNVDALLDPLRQDQRFQALRARLDFPN